jgi:hypothetical protein
MPAPPALAARHAPVRALPEQPVSDSITREAARETAAIAAGLSRAEAGQRAQRAFDSANDIRARLQGLPDIAKRAHAVSRARAWAEILQHMDSTEEPEFCGCARDRTPPAVARAAWAAWDWLAGLARLLSPATWAQVMRDLLGTEPVTFYQHAPAAPGSTARQPAERDAGQDKNIFNILFTPSVLTGARPTGAQSSAPRRPPPGRSALPPRPTARSTSTAGKAEEGTYRRRPGKCARPPPRPHYGRLPAPSSGTALTGPSGNSRQQQPPRITSAGDQPARQRESAGQGGNGSQPQSARSQETQHDTTSSNRA